jgi:hypothetical protein
VTVQGHGGPNDIDIDIHGKLTVQGALAGIGNCTIGLRNKGELHMGNVYYGPNFGLANDIQGHHVAHVIQRSGSAWDFINSSLRNLDTGHAITSLDFSVSNLSQLEAALSTSPRVYGVNTVTIYVTDDITVLSNLSIPANINVVLEYVTLEVTGTLTVNGSLRGLQSSENKLLMRSLLLVGVELNGSGLNAGNQGGFYGRDQAFRTTTWVWGSHGTYNNPQQDNGLGWWPWVIHVFNMEQLQAAEMYAKNVSWINITFLATQSSGPFEITDDVQMHFIIVTGVDVIVKPGASLEGFRIDVRGGGSLKGEGETSNLRTHLVGGLYLDNNPGPPGLFQPPLDSSGWTKWVWDTSGGEWVKE